MPERNNPRRIAMVSWQGRDTPATRAHGDFAIVTGGG